MVGDKMLRKLPKMSAVVHAHNHLALAVRGIEHEEQRLIERIET